MLLPLLTTLLIKIVTPTTCHCKVTDDAMYRASCWGAGDVLGKKKTDGFFLVLFIALQSVDMFRLRM